MLRTRDENQNVYAMDAVGPADGSAALAPESGRKAAPERVTDAACPYCGQRATETAYEISFVRGLLLVTRHGRYRLLGCVPCVRKKIVIEVAKSVTYGWFSPHALVFTLILVPANVCLAIFARARPDEVLKVLDEHGIASNQHEERVTSAFYHAAAAMIRVNGEANPIKVKVASTIFAQVIPGFDAAEFERRVVSWPRGKSLEQPVAFLAKFLDVGGRDLLLDLLAHVAMADGAPGPKERKQWIKAATTLGISAKDAKRHWETILMGEMAAA